MQNKLVARFAHLRPRLAKHRGTILGAVGALIVSAGFVSVGFVSRDRTAELEARLDRAERYREAAGRWAREFEPATPAEAASWSASHDAVRQLGTGPTYRVAVAELIARRAEELGLGEAQVRMEQADTISFGRLESGALTLDIGASALAVSFAGGTDAAAALMRRLPPQVDVRRVEITADVSGSWTRMLLILFRTSEGNGGHAG